MEIEATGALATAALVAHEIEPASAQSGAPKAHAAVCANCAAPVEGNFCSACGQRAHLHRSILHMGEEFMHGLLHFDAKAWRTMPLLLAKPGHLTRNYIDGQRTRYVSPLALFLFMMFLMFFIVSMTRGAQGELTPEAGAAKLVDNYQGKLARAESKLAAAKASGVNVSEASAEVSRARDELSQAVQAAAKLSNGEGGRNADGTLTRSSTLNITTGIPALDAPLKAANKNPDLVIYKLKSSAAKFTFLLVPLSLPFLWLMFFWRRNVAMYDHAVFVLYSLCFMALLFMSVSVLKYFAFKTAALLMFGLVPVHMFLQLRHTYGLTLWGTTWRTVLLMLSSVCVMALYLLTILVLTVS